MTCGKATPRTSFVDFQTSGLSVRIAAARQCVTIWALRRRQRLRLKGLDDHMLKDVGLSREEADEEARRPFWR